jgi:hypothetical protein
MVMHPERTKTRTLIIFAIVLPTPAWAQTVTLPELQGAIIESTVVHHALVSRKGEAVQQQVEVYVKLLIGPDGRIEDTRAKTSRTSGGQIRQGRSVTSSAILEQPRYVNSLGGGHFVWIFNDGTFTSLRTFATGAYKRDIVISRTAKGFTCTSQESYAREEGINTVEHTSDSGVAMTVLNSKQVSSVCKVTMSNQESAQ